MSPVKCSFFWFVVLCSARLSLGQTRQGPTIENAIVCSKDLLEIPAEEAGLLCELNVKLGSNVEKGQKLAQVDDREALTKLRLGQAEYASASKQASSDVEVRLGESKAKKAVGDYESAVAANRKVRGTFPISEIRRLTFEVENGQLSTEKAQLDQQVAMLTAQAKKTESELAEISVIRRHIVAPLTGQVTEILKHPGEWVNPGDSVLKLMNFQEMRVEGFVSAAQWDPGDLMGGNVQVTVVLARNRQEVFRGSVIHVDAEAQAGGQYKVLADVTNRQDRGQWLLRPGLDVAMHIEPVSPPRLDALTARENK